MEYDKYGFNLKKIITEKEFKELDKIVMKVIKRNKPKTHGDHCMISACFNSHINVKVGEHLMHKREKEIKKNKDFNYFKD